MSRREHAWVKSCAELGCKKREYMIFGTLRNYDEHARYRDQYPYRCSRHDRPDEVISAGQTEREIRYTVVDDRGRKAFAGGRTTRLQLGDAFDDFQAFAEDFPIGTVISVRAALVLVPTTPDTDGDEKP